MPGVLKANDSRNHPNPISPSDDDVNDHSAREGSTGAEENVTEDFSHLTGRQKRLFELRLKMVGIRKLIIVLLVNLMILESNLIILYKKLRFQNK